MKTEFEVNLAQIMALVNAMRAYNGDEYVTVGTWSYGFYRDDQNNKRHGYYDHALTLVNSVGNAITLEGTTLTYSGSRNAPWAGNNAIAHCFKAAGLIGADNEVKEQYRHIMPVSSKLPDEEWHRHSYTDWNGQVISTYVEDRNEPPAQPYDTVPDEEYRAI